MIRKTLGEAHARRHELPRIDMVESNRFDAVERDSNGKLAQQEPRAPRPEQTDEALARLRAVIGADIGEHERGFHCQGTSDRDA
ncbi:MAG: hypothetical protein ACO3IB_13790, partial [Phycisphaerales bacterium]